MRNRIVFFALVLVCCAPGAVRAQGTPAADSAKPMMSGVVRPTRPATVFMGFGWSFQTGKPLRITQVLDDSPASRAGLKVGDALLAADGHDPSEDGVLFPNDAPGRHHLLRVRRGDQVLELEIISDPPRAPTPAPAPAS
jgi:predicted metalloprotease with PDZ domain